MFKSILRILSLALLLPVVASAQGKVELGGKSLGDLQKVVQEDPNEPIGHYFVALAQWNAKKWDEVEKSLKTALELNPRFAPAHLTLAALPYAKRTRLWTEAASPAGIPTGAQAEVDVSDYHYRMAFFTDPATPLHILATVAIGVETSSDFGKAVAFCNEGEYGSCNVSINQYLSKQRGTSVTVIPRASLWYAVLAAIQTKDFASASGNLSTLSNRVEDDTRVLATSDLARIPLKSRDMEVVLAVMLDKVANQKAEALSSYQRMVREGTDNYLVHSYLATLLQANRNFDQAIEARQAALKLTQDDPMLYYEYGVTLAQAGKMAEAVGQLTTATEKMPRNALAWYMLGQAKAQSGDAAGAKDAYTKAVATATKAQAALAQNAQRQLGN